MGGSGSQPIVAHYTNYSNGRVIEYLPTGRQPCSSWLLLPAENLWSEAVRGILYIIAMLYIFVGVAIVSDVFICSIEVITSKKRKILKWDAENKRHVEKEVLIWNETVANLTLMALGSSAPEILLNIVEALQNLSEVDSGKPTDSLGTFTIIGSAAFNLLIISAICISSVPSPESKRVKEFGVFMVTAFWSIFAYVWILIVVVWNTPGEVDIWEAWVTLLYFPLLVLNAYCQDNGWWIKRPRVQGLDPHTGSQMNIRVVNGNIKKHLVFHGPSPQLATLEAERTQSHMNLKTASDDRANDTLALNDMEAASDDNRVDRTDEERKLIARASSSRNRFRHAAVRSILGGKKRFNTHKQPPSGPPRLIELVDKVRSMQDGRSAMVPITEDLRGKFTFAASGYSVLESAGKIEVEVLFHRSIPKSNGVVVKNGKAAAHEAHDENGTKDEDVCINAVVSVSYETREGTAKHDTEFRYTQGVLVFQETEWKKTISVPIINDNQYECNMDFYIILKNPEGGGSLGDPSLTHVTIIDDDVPGELSFDSPHYTADLEKGFVTANVIRANGSDGSVSIQYATIDGTARGGLDANKSDYRATAGTIVFEHQETSKAIEVEVNKNTKTPKNFVITLRNPSLGAKLGDNSAAVANIAADDIEERLANLLADEDDEDETWLGQMKSAMTVGGDRDDEGNEIPPAKMDYFFHFITFLWKVLFSLIPPRNVWGGWPAFCMSLVCIGILTAIVEQLASLLGCVLFIKAAVAGITIIALGTSVPDTFASRTAAIHDQFADAAIGNITGSNSVNVFLGLGVPWVISVMYNYAMGKGPFQIEQGNLFLSVILFTGIGSVCILMLVFRRKVIGGELGGGKVTKRLSTAFFVVLWLVYVIIMALKVYDVI